jgi:hypothetical protein
MEVVKDQTHAAEDNDVGIGLDTDAGQQFVIGFAGDGKMGIFWLSTKQLKTSIIGTLVSMNFLGTMRRVGFTDGPPASTRRSSAPSGVRHRWAGRLHQKRAQNIGRKFDLIERPRKWTRASVDRPLPPEKTCSETCSAGFRRSGPTIFAIPFSTTAKSPKPTLSARIVRISPTMERTFV